jgi:hypothetical protein
MQFGVDCGRLMRIIGRLVCPQYFRPVLSSSLSRLGSISCLLPVKRDSDGSFRTFSPEYGLRISQSMPLITDPESRELEAVRLRVDRNSHGHIRQALRLQRLNDLATFATAIGGIAAMALSAAFLGNSISDQWAALSLAFVSGIITLISVMQAIWRPGERARRHQDWSLKFSEIENDCRLVQCGVRAKSLEQILAEVELVYEQVDLIPERVWNGARVARSRALALQEKPTTQVEQKSRG